MSDILTVTLNPALDMSSAVDRVVPEDKLRCDAPVYDPGGGGINVARAIVQLGGAARAFVACGGFRGARLLQLVEAGGVTPIAWDVDGETRLSLAVIDRSDGQQYRFVMPGPDWTPAMVENVLQAVAGEVRAGGLVVLSGSQPPGVPETFPTLLARAVTARGAQLVLDTSGPPLHALLDEGAAQHHVLRLDGAESEGLAGRKLDSPEEAADFAQELVRRGVAEIVVLALGARGSVLAEDGRRWHGVTPPVEVQSKVGAGDSFVGALTLALSRNTPPQEALRQGVAAASAAVMSDATALCRPVDYQALVSQVRLSAI